MMLREPTRDTDGPTEFGGHSHRVATFVWTGKPVEIPPETEEQFGEFTEGVFEDALDKVSQPIKGKYADSLPSSEEFIKDKRREVELEDR
ncbi:MAG: hypothetical protein H0T55_10400 [Rubrobacteraceae bacterium]|nr:hypothetical protein [Rubrobacteraceae bacterium]MBA3617751.1 hypothetical protein [Rubrobacteraceae bacterium]MDQ3436700.1 hypothetical protein [Actinomycetota bacterium]